MHRIYFCKHQQTVWRDRSCSKDELNEINIQNHDTQKSKELDEEHTETIDSHIAAAKRETIKELWLFVEKSARQRQEIAWTGMAVKSKKKLRWKVISK